LPTSFIGTNRLSWWDQISFIIKASRPPAFELSYPYPMKVRLSDGPRKGAINDVLRVYKSPENYDPARFLSQLGKASGVAVPETSPERLFMNWDEARQMSLGGMDIGSHTHTHELLSKLSLEQQIEELSQSRSIIETRLGAKVDAIAYPVGARSSFNTNTFKALQVTSYRTGFSFYGGVNRPGKVNHFDVARTGVDAELKFATLRFQTAYAAGTGSSPW
jgi:peptidoglycan/xylan/chitin deacetylase (PgdA/CDA1 family)